MTDVVWRRLGQPSSVARIECWYYWPRLRRQPGFVHKKVQIRVRRCKRTAARRPRNESEQQSERPENEPTIRNEMAWNLRKFGEILDTFEFWTAERAGIRVQPSIFCWIAGVCALRIRILRKLWWISYEDFKSWYKVELEMVQVAMEYFEMENRERLQTECSILKHLMSVGCLHGS